MFLMECLAFVVASVFFFFFALVFFVFNSGVIRVFELALCNKEGICC